MIYSADFLPSADNTDGHMRHHYVAKHCAQDGDITLLQGVLFSVLVGQQVCVGGAKVLLTMLVDAQSSSSDFRGRATG